IAHLLEDLLEPCRRGRTGLTPELVDEALAAVDGLRAVIDLAGREQDHTVEADGVEKRLLRAARAQGAVVTAAIAPAPVAAAAVAPVTAVAAAPAAPAAEPQVAATAPPPSAPAPAARAEAATIAVPVARLDELVRLVTESS